LASYVKSTNFASKDSLPLGDPLKIVKGTEIDTEFNNIATAVGTKADLISPTFTGIPAAPTASPGTNTTQLATTAFVTAAISAAVLAQIYPVGSVYINASVATNPATLLGFGTWTEIGAGRVLVGQDASDASFDVMGETGGSKDAIVVSHTHSVTDPGHIHAPPSGLTAPWLGNSKGGADGAIDGSTVVTANDRDPQSGNTQSATTGISLSSTGSSGTNANLQPYVVVKMWQRSA
jgi:hypothetical protein